MMKVPGLVVPKAAGLVIRQGVPSDQAHCGERLLGTARGAGGVKVAGS